MLTQMQETLNVLNNQEALNNNSNNGNSNGNGNNHVIRNHATLRRTSYQESRHGMMKRKRYYSLSLATLILLGAFFLCTLIGVGFIVYNFATCDHLINAGLHENIICTTVHLKQHPNTLKNTSILHGKIKEDNDDDDDDDDDKKNANKNKDAGNNDNNDDDDAGKRLSSIRLPRSIKPLKYNITIVPYLYHHYHEHNNNDNHKKNFTFNGEVQIKILALSDSYNITMHAVDLNISTNDVTVQCINNHHNDNDNDNDNDVRMSDISLYNQTKWSRMKPNAASGAGTDDAGGSGDSGGICDDGDNLLIRRQYFMEKRQFFIIEFHEKLLHNRMYVINMKFTGSIQDYLQGFYRSSYRNRKNETRWLVSTQFQATDARRAFPCFDEPALKANFTLNIARPKNMSAISNMPRIVTKKHPDLPDYEWDLFAESMPMSTYLVAYSISDFQYLRKGNFSVWTRPDAIQSAQYALNVGPKILQYLEEFFNVPFPLPKIDMIALPDFQAGAMENWGLITFREAVMLFEEGASATIHKQRIAAVVGHELAHQWFGNLVTPSWWSDIWLNEGFASYLEYLIVDAIEPSWNYMDQFIVNELQYVFQLDALSTSHQISVEVGNPEEISEIFDRISYAKGSTIIRMMNHFLTAKVFRKGLNRYLKEMAFNSAEQNDLWHYLTMEGKMSGLLKRNITVKNIMDTWTLQVGFPVIQVTREPSMNVIRLEQKRFLYESNRSRLQASKMKDEPLWWIPITYTTNVELNFENTRPLTWIPKTKIYEIESENLIQASWYIFNIQVTGYYRLNYDRRNWQAIIDYLMNANTYRNIVASNRAQLIDDAMNLARAGMLPYELSMNLTKYLKHEEDHAPWKSAITSFFFLDAMFINQAEYHLLKNYLLKLLQPAYDSVGFMDPLDKTDMLQLAKRIDIVQMACHMGNRDCVSESVRHFQNWIQVPNPDVNNPIPPNLRSIVYCTAIQYGTDLEWNFAYERFTKTSISSEMDLLLTALGCSREPWLLARYLRYAISDDHNIRKQDVLRVFAAVASNVIGQQLAFNFIRENWNIMKQYLGSTTTNMNSILKMIISHSNSRYQLNELETFVKYHIKDNSRMIQQMIEQVSINVNWMSRNYKTIVKWLRQNEINN